MELFDGLELESLDLIALNDGENPYTDASVANGFRRENAFFSKKLEKAGNWASDTAELFFEDVRVPRRYLVGQEGMGFMYLMQNFQSERLVGCVSGLSGAKLALDSARPPRLEPVAVAVVARRRAAPRARRRPEARILRVPSGPGPKRRGRVPERARDGRVRRRQRRFDRGDGRVARGQPQAPARGVAGRVQLATRIVGGAQRQQ